MMFTGVVRLNVKPVSGPPFAGNVRVSFAQKPMVDFSVKTLGASVTSFTGKSHIVNLGVHIALQHMELELDILACY